MIFVKGNISIHAPLAGCDAAPTTRPRNTHISIHAPLAGCDLHPPRLHLHGENFNPRTPCGVRPPPCRGLPKRSKFQSTHPLRGATQASPTKWEPRYISIHAPLAGCDHFVVECRCARDISIHAPLAGCDPVSYQSMSSSHAFQSTHPLRGATILRRVRTQTNIVSIHAPLAGCDKALPAHKTVIVGFNPRTPCGVRRGCRRPLRPSHPFQSTHPLRGATAGVFSGSQPACVSIHAPLAGCDEIFIDCRLNLGVSIHAPLAGCDRLCVAFDRLLYVSIHAPHAGCDDYQYRRHADYRISIHVPHAGCDSFQWCFSCWNKYFNPRTPCGVRPRREKIRRPCGAFQSTHPMRGATIISTAVTLTTVFQSTHPMRGATVLTIATMIRPRHFNPRTPCGVRHNSMDNYSDGLAFQSTHPIRGATFSMKPAKMEVIHFNPRTPCGVRLRSDTPNPKIRTISIHAPHAGCDSVLRS